MSGNAVLHAAWIGVDWGTSNLRAWVIDDDGAAIERLGSTRGMGQLAREDFGPALLELIEPWLRDDAILPVICCGMVGARQGWVDAGYVATPCPPPGAEQAVRAPLDDPRVEVRILPGIKQLTPADVMRGEETQLAGLLAERGEFNGTICLPGTHTKWVDIDGGVVRSFRTVMTGEVFGLLAMRSILRHSVGGEQIDFDAFDETVAAAAAHSHGLFTRLFTLRAESLLNDLDAATARGRLSGLLIGDEIAAMESYWRDRPVAIVGAVGLSDLYRRALTANGVEVVPTDGERLTLAGLARAHGKMEERENE